MADQEATRKAAAETLAANFDQWVSKGRRPLTQLKCGCTNLSPSLWAPCDTHRLIVQADVFAVDEVVIGLARITQTARPGTAEVTIAVKP